MSDSGRVLDLYGGAEPENPTRPASAAGADRADERAAALAGTKQDDWLEELWQGFPRLRAPEGWVLRRPRASALVYEAPRPDRLLWAGSLEGPAEVARFTSDDRAIVAATRNVSLWSIPTDGQPARGATSKQDMVWGLALSPEAGLAAFGGGRATVELLDLATGRAVRTLGKHDQPFWALAFSPDGKRLATGSFDHTLRVWDTAGVAAPLTLTGHTSQVWSVMFSLDGQYVASGGADPDDIRVWDAATGAQLAVLKGPAQVMGLAFDRTAHWLALGSGSPGVPVYDWRKGVLDVMVPVPTTVLSVGFGPDNRLAAGCQDNMVRLYRVNPGPTVTDSPLMELSGHTHWVSMVHFSRNGEFLVTAAQDRTVRVWDLRERQGGAFAGTQGSCAFAHITADGARVVAADDSGLRAWSLDGAPQGELPYPDARVRGMSLDGRGDGLIVLARGEHLELERVRGLTRDPHPARPPCRHRAR